METLRLYINQLAPDDQRDFATRCGTSVGYLRKAISTGQRFDGALVVNIQRESGGTVRCEDLRPDIDWAYLRSTDAPAPGREAA